MLYIICHRSQTYVEPGEERIYTAHVAYHTPSLHVDVREKWGRTDTCYRYQMPLHTRTPRMLYSICQTYAIWRGADIHRACCISYAIGDVVYHTPSVSDAIGICGARADIHRARCMSYAIGIRCHWYICVDICDMERGGYTPRMLYIICHRSRADIHRACCISYAIGIRCHW